MILIITYIKLGASDMSENKFSAKIKIYGKKNLPKVSNSNELQTLNQNSGLFKNDVSNSLEKMINLDSISLHTLTQQLADSLDKKQPIFLWSKRREINKIKLDIERQYELKRRIESLRQVGYELMQLRADALVSELLIPILAEQKYEQAKADLARTVNKSKAETSYYNRKIEENYLEIEKMRNTVANTDAFEKVKIDILRTKASMFSLVIDKLKDGSINTIDSDKLHEIFNFFNQKSNDDYDAIARYHKIMSEVDKNKADSFKTYAEGHNKMSDKDYKDLENFLKYQNIMNNMKDN